MTYVEQGLLGRVAGLVAAVPGHFTVDTLTQQLAQILNVDCAFLVEANTPPGPTLHILSCWSEGAHYGGDDLEVTDALRFHLHNRSGWCFAAGAADRLPLDTLFRGLQPEGSAGIPLLNEQGLMVGLLGCASRAPFREPSQVRNVLQLVGLRAATELERRRADATAFAQESRSQILLEGCQDAVTLLSATGERIYCSPMASYLLGYTPEEFADQSLFDAVHPDDAQEASALLNQLRQQPGAKLVAELRCRHRNGSWRWIHTVGINLLDQREVGAIVCTWRDITEQREAEAALRAGDERFRGLVANIPGAVYRCMAQPEGVLQYVSDGIEEITGYPAADYLHNAQRSFLNLIHPEDQERVVREVLRAAAANEPFAVEYRSLHRSGEVRWIRSRGRTECTPDGTPLWIDGVLFDDTERRVQEQQLADQNMALLYAAEGIGRLDLNGCYLHVNPAYAEMLGRKPEELVGQSWQITVHPSEIPRVLGAYADVHQDGKAELELRGLRADGSSFYKHSALVLARDEAGVPKGYFCFTKDVTARRAAEEALRCSEARFRALVEKASDVVGVLDVEGNICYESPAIEPITGFTSAEVTGRNVFDFIHPDEVAEIRAAFQRLVENPGLSLDLSYRCKCKDGSWRAIEATLTSLLDQPGVHGVVINGRDVTERLAVEARVRFQAAALDALKEATEEGVLLVNPEGEIFTCNRRFQDLWQLPNEIVAQRSDEEALAAAVPLLADPDGFRARVQQLMRTQEISEDEIFLKDGRVFERYGAPVRGEDGTAYGRVWRFRDITERKRAERRDHAFRWLGQSLNTAATPREAAQVVLRVADQLLGWDACWLDLFSEGHRTTTSLVAQDLIDGVRKDVAPASGRVGLTPMARRVLAEGPLLILRDAGEPPRATADAWLPFGDVKRASASILCVPIRSGERVIGAVSIQSYRHHAYDPAALATFQALADYCGGALERTLLEAARGELEQQLVQSQKMEAIGRLAGGVAHDFNNMLAVISGYSELLLLKAPEGDPVHGPLEQIRKAADRAAKLTQQLLAFSRKQLLQPQVLNLNDVVLGVNRMLHRLIGEDIELLTLGNPTVHKIEADPGQIEQVLLNLAVNARDAMPRGGKITLQTRNVKLDEDQASRIPGARPGDYVLLTVSDTGCGMDAETLERIFEPFYTTKALGKGTGLGLSTVYGIVSQSEGFIQVESAPEQGTTFYIYFPAVDRPVTAAGSSEGELPESSPSRETVLVAEDEPMVRDLIRRVLETCGYEVLEARHGEEALKVGETFAGPIHHLLTDVVMPRMSGRELAERLRGLRPEMKVLFMSGYTDDEVLRHGLASLEADFLQKPFSPQALARMVEKLLHP